MHNVTQSPRPTPEQEERWGYWARWHDLRDIREKRDLTESEQVEYDGYMVIVKDLDAEEEALLTQIVDRLAEKHERVLASIRRLTEAVEGKRNG